MSQCSLRLPPLFALMACCKTQRLTYLCHGPYVRGILRVDWTLLRITTEKKATASFSHHDFSFFFVLFFVSFFLFNTNPYVKLYEWLLFLILPVFSILRFPPQLSTNRTHTHTKNNKSIANKQTYAHANTTGTAASDDIIIIIKESYKYDGSSRCTCL